MSVLEFFVSKPGDESAGMGFMVALQKRPQPWIEDIMKEMSLTQEALGEVLGMSQSQVSKKLNGELAFKITDIPVLCRFLGIDLATCLINVTGIEDFRGLDGTRATHSQRSAFDVERVRVSIQVVLSVAQQKQYKLTPGQAAALVEAVLKNLHDVEDIKARGATFVLGMIVVNKEAV